MGWLIVAGGLGLWSLLSNSKVQAVVENVKQDVNIKPGSKTENLVNAAKAMTEK
jgi:hypothetical protein